MLNLFRLTPIGRLARRARWALAPSVSALTGRLSVRLPRSVMESGVPTSWVVRVENHSRGGWLKSGPDQIGLQYRWIARTGQDFGPEVVVPLPRTLLPGDWADISVDVTGPTAVGDFILEWGLTGGVGTAPGNGLSESVPVHITFPRSSDIDYHHVYRTANLEANSWWVVGAYPSQEEYFQSSAARREMLIGLGLTPDSRVLDIGCGTGQMAMALEGCLTDRGAYYGTDIGQEAIDYCRQKYRRPNFAFAVGEMTRVPFPTSAGPFDMAIFFSVFTHTFVDESALLLAETARLLGPRGVVVADVIASDLVARGAGHRGQMWVNWEHFERLAGAVGFQAEVVGRFPWGTDAERLMFRLSRR